MSTSQRRPGSPGGRVLANAIVFVSLAYFIVPLFWLVISSTKTNGDLFSTFGLWAGNSNAFADNVNTIFTASDGIYFLWLRNTVLYSTASALGAATFATAAGYAFAKFRFRGRKLLFGAILVSVAVPATILIVPLFLMMSRLGIVNTAWAVILPSMVSPFGVYLMWIFADETLPSELLEAARVDGAGELKIFRSIGLPLLLPGFVTVLLFSFVATWNNYFLPLLVLSDQGKLPLTVGLAQWNFQASASTGGGAVYATYSMVITGALIAIVPLILAFLFLQRYWHQGLTMGSVKG